MEVGKGVEAGPSTAGVVSETQERQKKMTEKAPAETVIDDGEEEEDNGIPVAGFVLGLCFLSRNRLKKTRAQGCAYEKLLEKISYARVTTRCTEGKLSADESRYGASSQKEEPEMIS
ncbi:hypothetical protein GH714_026733 [Hevea brasiliensis]|uniref:Uncharacterized protein n=1 Tax=Hevea brasiliensis TaxID=3981 RepID=A0A6A6KUJ7_HEVBR|nr:hypothetical protein GH714_026733 [Hevea brasiliensis]